MWEWLLAILTWLASDPAAIEMESPRAAACSWAAYATFAPEKELTSGGESR